jgi:hypothetical protein
MRQCTSTQGDSACTCLGLDVCVIYCGNKGCTVNVCVADERSEQHCKGLAAQWCCLCWYGTQVHKGHLCVCVCVCVCVHDVLQEVNFAAKECSVPSRHVSRETITRKADAPFLRCGIVQRWLVTPTHCTHLPNPPTTCIHTTPSVWCTAPAITPHAAAVQLSLALQGVQVEVASHPAMPRQSKRYGVGRTGHPRAAGRTARAGVQV